MRLPLVLDIGRRRRGCERACVVYLTYQQCWGHFNLYVCWIFEFRDSGKTLLSLYTQYGRVGGADILRYIRNIPIVNSAALAWGAAVC